MQQPLEELSIQLNMSLYELTELCRSLAEAMTDMDFVTQMLSINNDINHMSADNW